MQLSVKNGEVIFKDVGSTNGSMIDGYGLTLFIATRITFCIAHRKSFSFSTEVEGAVPLPDGCSLTLGGTSTMKVVFRSV